MGSMTLDFKKMKFLSSDGKSTTFKHPAGHTITIAHNVLSPGNKAALQEIANRNQTSSQAQEAQAQSPGKPMAEGGQPKQSNQPDPKDIQDAKAEMREKAAANSAGSGATSISDALDKLSHPWAKGGRVKMAEGGDNKVPIPTPSTTDNSQRAKQLTEGAQKPDIDQSPLITGDWSHVWNKGGQIKMADGGPPKMLAQPQQQNQPMPQPQSQAQQPDIGGVSQVVGQQSPAPSAPSLQFSEATPVQQYDATGKPVGPAPNSGGWKLDTDKLDAWFNPQPVVRDNLGNVVPQPASPYNYFNDPKQAVTPQDLAQVKADMNARNAQTNADIAANTADAVHGNVPPNTNPANNPKRGDNMPEQGQYKVNIPAEERSFPGVQEQVRGNQLGAQAAGTLGEMNAAALQRNIDLQNQAMKQFNDSVNQLNQERQNAIHDLQNNHIDPDQYWSGTVDANGNKVGGHSKFMAGLGMLVAGFLGGGQQAAQYLNQQIDRNLTAQQADLGRRKTLLEANIQQYGNARLGMDATRIMLHDMAANSLQRNASSMADPIERARALQLSGQILSNTAPMAMKWGVMHAVENLSNSGNPDAIRPLLAKTAVADPETHKILEAAYVPGIGTTYGLTAVDKDDRNRIEAYQNTFRLLDQAINFKQTHPEASWHITDRGAAGTLMTQLQNTMRQAEHMGVWKKSETDMFMDMLGSSPADFTAKWTTDPELRTTLDLKRGEFQTLLKNSNLPTPKGSQTQPTQTSGQQYREGQQAVMPDGRRLQFRGGKWHNERPTR